MASLPTITVNFLLKDTLGMTAAQAAYFGAIAIVGWAIKPLWGIISDTVPFFGYRRKPYLVIMAFAAAVIWFALGQTESYTVKTLLLFFACSSVAYAFMDVTTDALMVESGKPTGLTGRFQSVQWTSVYVASIITGIGGGWVAEHLAPQTVFSINAVFPLIILFFVLLFVREQKVENTKEQFRKSIGALKKAFKTRTVWLLAVFLFFWTFSPSFGAPFFYYAVDTLKFNPLFFGIVVSALFTAAAWLILPYLVFTDEKVKI